MRQIVRLSFAVAATVLLPEAYFSKTGIETWTTAGGVARGCGSPHLRALIGKGRFCPFDRQ